MKNQTHVKYTLIIAFLALLMSLLLPFDSFGQCPDDGIIKISRVKNVWWNIPMCSEVLADSTFKITFDSLHQHPNNFAFAPPVRGFNDKIERPMGAAYWVRFTIRNEDSIPVYLMIGVYKKEMERLQLFMEDENGEIDTFPMIGAAIPFRPKTMTANYIFPVNFAPKKTYKLHLYLDDRDMPLLTQIAIRPAEDFIPVKLFHKMGFFSGLSLTYTVIALIMFIFNRKPLYFSYFIYTFGGTGYLTSICNMGYEYIWSGWVIFASISDDFMGGITLIGFLLMTIFFFDTPQYFKVLDKLLKGVIAVTLLTMLSGLFRKVLPFGAYYYMTLVWMPTVLLVIPVVLAVGIQSYLRFRRREALMFLLGFTSLLTTIVFVVLTEFGFEWFREPAHGFLPNFTVFFEFTIMFIVLIYRLRDEWTSKKIKELELQQTLSEQRQRISRDLHDDVGSTLNSISVYSEIAKQQLQTLHPESLSVLDRIGDSSRDLVSTINDIVWAINPQNDKFENIALKMRLFAADLLMPKDVDLDFQADTQLNEVNLSLEERKQFYLIFKEAINNVYKSAECSTLKVHLEFCEKDICMTIIDNGKGFDTSNPKQGNGLKSMAERAKILRGVLEIDSELEKGTTVKLRFPIEA
jgi:signal transduction histidine kinase